MSLVRSLSLALLASLLSAGCAPHAAAPASAHPVVTRPAATLDRAAVRRVLAERRAVTIQRFLAYRDAQVYPFNPGPGTAHLWIDGQGNLCAAATIISGDWGRDATVAAVDGQLGLRLADVQGGRLGEWMLTSGLTHHELVAIQVPGWEGPTPVVEDPRRAAEIARLYQIYLDVERQLTTLADESLEQAVDALMARPALARSFLADPQALVAALSPFAVPPSTLAVAIAGG